MFEILHNSSRLPYFSYYFSQKDFETGHCYISVNGHDCGYSFDTLLANLYLETGKYLFMTNEKHLKVLQISTSTVRINEAE